MDASLAGGDIARGSDRFIISEIDASYSPDGRRAPRKTPFTWRTARFRPPGDYPAMALLDGNPKTGFGIVGRAKAPFLILRFARPLHTSAKSTLIVKVHQDSDYRQATIGRFRVGLSSGMYSWDGNPAPKTDAAGTAKQINEEAKAEVKSAAPSRKRRPPQPKENTDNEASGETETGPSTVAGLPKSLLKALELPEQKRSAGQAAQIRDYFEYSSPRLFPARLALAKLEMNQSFLNGAVAEVMITESVEPRVTRVLPRGNWMDDSGQIVQPAIPEFLGASKRAAAPPAGSISKLASNT